MKRPFGAAWICLTLAGCDGSTTVRGTMAEGADPDSVWNFTSDARTAVIDGAFELAGGGDVIDLRFLDDDDWSTRMEIRGAPGGVVELVGIRTRDGLATPIAIRTGGDAVVTINGIRMMDADAFPAEISAEGEVIGVSGSGDAILLRPNDDALPDLRVVITPGTAVTDAEGAPTHPARFEVGDSASVVGAVAEGYVVARELIASDT